MKTQLSRSALVQPVSKKPPCIVPRSANSHPRPYVGVPTSVLYPLASVLLHSVCNGVKHD